MLSFRCIYPFVASSGFTSRKIYILNCISTPNLHKITCKWEKSRAQISLHMHVNTQHIKVKKQNVAAYHNFAALAHVTGEGKQKLGFRPQSFLQQGGCRHILLCNGWLGICTNLCTNLQHKYILFIYENISLPRVISYDVQRKL